jgi:predicted nucleic acid-binding protein
VRILVDTNVLLRAIRRADPLSRPARDSLKRLHRRGYDLCVTPQNVKEFWNVCTRPTDNNGMGLSVTAAERHTQFLERHFTILPDSTATYQEWRALLVTHEISGKQVHDAYLVAAMKAHGVTQILTFDVNDFARFKSGDIQAMHPEGA